MITKAQTLYNGFSEFLNSDKGIDDYMSLFMMVNKVTTQGSGLIWPDVRHQIKDILTLQYLNDSEHASDINPSKKPHQDVLEAMVKLLDYKNDKYGNSANSPLRIFSKADAEEGIAVRLDDKIGRIKNSKELRKNDISDMIGYLALLCVDKGWTDFSEFMD